MTRTNPVKPTLRIFLCCIALISLKCASPPDTQRLSSEISHWKKVGPGGGGSTFIPVFSANNPDNFMVRCDMTGTYHTTDGGESYHQLNFANGSSSYAYDPSNENIIYVGSAVLNRSDDGGVTWKQIFPDSTELVRTEYIGDHATFRVITSEDSLYPSQGSIRNLRVDPVNGNSIYFSSGSDFFHSADGGGTWSRETLQSPALAIYTNNSSASETVYIFCAEQLYLFDKKQKRLTSSAHPRSLSPAVSFTAGTVAGSDSIIFYALHNRDDENQDDEFGHTQLWVSRDVGKSWNQIKDDIITNKNGVIPSFSMIACAERDALDAYVVSNRYLEKIASGDTVYWYGAMKTGDGGSTWNWVWKGGGGSGQYGVKDGQGVSNLKDAWSEKAFGGEYIRLLDAGVYGNDGDVAVVTDWYRTMKTTDGGKSWREIYSIEQEDDTYTSRGMDVTTAYGVHFDPFDTAHIAISYTDIGYHHSYNGGKSWKRSVTGVPWEWVNTCYWLVFDPDVKGKVWSVWSSLHDFPRGKMTRNPKWKEYGKGGVCVSSDGGNTWTPSNEGMGFDSPATSIVLDPQSPPGKRTLYASVFNKGIFKSTDDGKTWVRKNKGMEENVAAFELTLSPNGDLFVTVSATPMHKNGKTGLDFYSGAVYRSVDSAETWTKLNVSNGLLFPNGVGIDPKNPDRIYLGCWADITLSDLVGGNVIRQTGAENKMLEFPGGIFLSEDGGDTWTPLFDPDQYVYDVTVDPYHPGRIYCNTFNQVAWQSDDYGKTWNKIKGYDFHWGHRVVIDEANREKIYLTTYGSSVWHSN